MTTIDKRRYQMLTQVRDFGVAHGDLFPLDSSARSAFAIVTAEVERLDALKLTARAAMRAARAARRVEARTLLVDALVRAKNTARVLAKTIPQLATQVELPEGVNDRRILSVTRQFLEAIGPYLEQFAAHGVSADELQKHVESLETAINERELRRKERSQAREEIDRCLARALEAIETLDVAVANHLASNPERLAEWKRTRALSRTTRRGKGDDAEAAPTPAAAEATSAAASPEAASVTAAPNASSSPPVVPLEKAA